MVLNGVGDWFLRRDRRTGRPVRGTIFPEHRSNKQKKRNCRQKHAHSFQHGNTPAATTSCGIQVTRTGMGRTDSVGTSNSSIARIKPVSVVPGAMVNMQFSTPL